MCDDLNEEYPVGPDVRLDGEPAVESSLRGRPLDGELGTYTHNKFNRLNK